MLTDPLKAKIAARERELAELDTQAKEQQAEVERLNCAIAQEIAGMKERLEKMLKWGRQVSKDTGIELPSEFEEKN